MSVYPTRDIAEIDIQDAGLSHLQAGFSLIEVDIISTDEELPYNNLGGLGFERLCYQLILAEGKTPHFFGGSGVGQFGIDLIVFDGKECVVYQCKNYGHAIYESDLKKILKKFEDEWLNDKPQLPIPRKFILCITLSLTSGKLKESWLKLKEDFFNRTNVEIDDWDLDLLNSKLKKLPDVVADLFSAEVAERFCDEPNWRENFFRPVKQGSGDLIIKRYLSLKNNGRLYLGKNLQKSFIEKLSVDGTLLIQGLPGSGKSLTSLAFSEELNQGQFRIFYVDLHLYVSEQELFDGIRRRMTRPTVFIFDNCQGQYQLLENLYDQLKSLPLLNRHRLIFITRTNSTTKELPLRELSFFVEMMKEKETVLTFQPTAEDFQKVIALVKPELNPLTSVRLNKLYNITARDLYLLNQVLDIIESPEDIDQLKTEQIYRAILKKYFEAQTMNSEWLINLAVLGQFDLAPPVDFFKSLCRDEDSKAKEQLIIEADTPVRYYFIHSSAAELVYRTLIWCETIENYHLKTANYLTNYFKRLIAYFRERKDGNQKIADELHAALRNKLKLEENKEQEIELKSVLLSDDEVFHFVENNYPYFSPAFTTLTLSILIGTKQEIYQRYCELFQRKLNDGTLLNLIIKYGNAQILTFLKKDFPSWFSTLHIQFCNTGILTLLRTKNIRTVLRFITGFAKNLENNSSSDTLSATTAQDWQEMFKRTIASKPSIGTLHLTLRELKQIDQNFWGRLEQKIGAGKYLYLIAELGTVSELFKILEYSTHSMAQEMIESLDELLLINLIEKTIEQNRSIGTIGLALRELKQIDRDLLRRLEQKIGASQYLHLIAELGTVVDLLSIIRHSTHSMVQEMIEALDDDLLDNLIEKTIRKKSSIGTIDLALRELKRENKILLNKLESRIGVENWWKLILANGNLAILRQITRRMTDSSKKVMVSYAATISTKDWIKLIKCGNLKSLSAFTCWGTYFFEKIFDQKLLENLTATFEELITTARWSDLNKSSRWLKKSPQSLLKQHLQNLICKYLQDINLENTNFDSLNESAGYFGTLNHYHFENQKEFPRIFDILPDVANWYDEKFLRAVRPLFFALTVSVVPYNDLIRVLNLGNNERVAVLFSKESTLCVFLYLWNLFALHFECRLEKTQEQKKSFKEFLHPSIKNKVWEILMKRLNLLLAGDNYDKELVYREKWREISDVKNETSETEHLIALCGFAASWNLIELKKVEKDKIIAALKSPELLLKRIGEMDSFIVSVFYLLGLEYLYGKSELNITSDVVQNVLSNAGNYNSSRNKAVNSLYRAISEKFSV